WPKLKLVHCGLENDFYANAPVVTEGKRRLVCVGRLAQEKGHVVLINALAMLSTKGIGLELVLAGDGPLKKEVEKLARELGVQDRVRITGWIGSDRVR